MPSDDSRRERDLILAPNEYAFILDETKGNVINYVGPHKTSLANTDQPALTRQKAKLDQDIAVAQQRMAQRLEELRAEVEAVVNKAGAVSPQLVAALQAFSDRALAERMAESMAPLAILGGKSVAEVLAQLLKGTILEKVLAQPESQEL